MIEALHSLYIREKVLESKIVTLLGVHVYINTSWINGSLERRKKKRATILSYRECRFVATPNLFIFCEPTGQSFLTDWSRLV
jgi:hypothetical protein